MMQDQKTAHGVVTYDKDTKRKQFTTLRFSIISALPVL